MNLYFAALASFAAMVAAQDAVVHLPMSRVALETAPELMRRAGSLGASIGNNRSFYTIDFALGTPPQPMTLVLDTGFSDTVVLNELACEGVYGCMRGSRFLEDDSSTYRSNGTDFSAAFLTDSTASGEWGHDTLQLGGHNISNFNFAVANESTSHMGVAGLAPAAGERVYRLGKVSTPYSNLLQQLKEQGVVQQAAFSLWLNNEGAGEVLFGGIDHAKFATDLYRLPLLPTNDNSTVTQYAVQLTGLSIYDGEGQEQPFTTCDIPAVLDTSSPISALPLDLIQPFFEALGVIYWSTDIYIVPCNALSSQDGGLGLQLGGGLDVTVGFDDLFTKIGATDSQGVEYCVPGFVVTEDWPAVIGENVLRTLYVVYDADNSEVGIAPAHTGSAASSASIEVLSTGIPGPLISNVLNSTGGEDSDFATRPVTLLTATFTRDVSAAGIDSGAALSSWGYTHVSWTATPSATHSVVIGAKPGAVSTKSAAAAAVSSNSRLVGLSSAHASTGVVSSRLRGASTATQSSPKNSQPAQASSRRSGANRQAGSSAAAAPSSSAAHGDQSAAGGAVTPVSSLLAVAAGVILSLL